MKITLKDIAEAAGCAESTVSRSLTGTGRISKATRQKILSHAKRLGYISHCRNVMILLPGETISHYFCAMCSALLKALSLHNYVPVITHLKHIGLVDELPLCAVISILSENKLSRVWGGGYQYPLISLNTRSERIGGVYRISSNERQGMGLILRQFADTGHNRIVRVGTCSCALTDENWSFFQRNNIFNELAEIYGLDKSPFMDVSTHLDPLLSSLSTLLKKKPTGLLIQSEDYLIPVLHCLRILKVRIPEDLSVAAWTYRDEQIHTVPNICGVMQDYDRIADTVCSMLEQILVEKTVPVDTEIDYISLSGNSIRNLKTEI